MIFLIYRSDKKVLSSNLKWYDNIFSLSLSIYSFLSQCSGLSGLVSNTILAPSPEQREIISLNTVSLANEASLMYAPKAVIPRIPPSPAIVPVKACTTFTPNKVNELCLSNLISNWYLLYISCKILFWIVLLDTPAKIYIGSLIFNLSAIFLTRLNSRKNISLLITVLPVLLAPWSPSIKKSLVFVRFKISICLGVYNLLRFINLTIHFIK